MLLVVVDVCVHCCCRPPDLCGRCRHAALVGAVRGWSRVCLGCRPLRRFGPWTKCVTLSHNKLLRPGLSICSIHVEYVRMLPSASEAAAVLCSFCSTAPQVKLVASCKWHRCLLTKPPGVAAKPSWQHAAAGCACRLPPSLVKPPRASQVGALPTACHGPVQGSHQVHCCGSIPLRCVHAQHGRHSTHLVCMADKVVVCPSDLHHLEISSRT